MIQGGDFTAGLTFKYFVALSFNPFLHKLACFSEFYSHQLMPVSFIQQEIMFHTAVSYFI